MAILGTRHAAYTGWVRNKWGRTERDILSTMQETGLLKVLLVDDELTILAVLARIIRQWGGEADCVDNASAGVDAMGAKHYDLVLLDLRMPRRDGIWFVENAPPDAQTQIVLMTAYVPERVLARLYDLGINDYLEKPFTCMQLTGLLDRCPVRSDSA